MIESRMNEEQVSPMRYLLFLFVFMNVCGVSYGTGKNEMECVPIGTDKNDFCPGSDGNSLKKCFLPKFQ